MSGIKEVGWEDLPSLNAEQLGVMLKALDLVFRMDRAGLNQEQKWLLDQVVFNLNAVIDDAEKVES